MSEPPKEYTIETPKFLTEEMTHSCRLIETIVSQIGVVVENECKNGAGFLSAELGTDEQLSFFKLTFIK
jgi:hypothetical protein